RSSRAWTTCSPSWPDPPRTTSWRFRPHALRIEAGTAQAPTARRSGGVRAPGPPTRRTGPGVVRPAAPVVPRPAGARLGRLRRRAVRLGDRPPDPRPAPAAGPGRPHSEPVRAPHRVRRVVGGHLPPRAVSVLRRVPARRGAVGAAAGVAVR